MKLIRYNMMALVYGIDTAIQCRPYYSLRSHQADLPNFLRRFLLEIERLDTYAPRVAPSDTTVDKQIDI